MFFNWVNAHVGIQGNELGDRLAKKAETDDKEEIVYGKIPRDYNYRGEGECNKLAGTVDNLYKRSDKKIILPTFKRENEDQDTYFS